MNHTCGRRADNGMDDETSPFRGSGKNLDSYRPTGGCTYCGSVSQEALFTFLKAGGEIGPTDKNYKAYLHDVDGVKAPGIKFYFQHLDDAGKTEFIRMVNAKEMKIGFPDHFYSLPFFMQRSEPAA